MQLPDSASVLADFDNQAFTHFSDEYRFIRDGNPTVPGDQISVIARGDTLPVQYAFGHDPLQQVLLSGERGRMQALTVAWDTGGKNWFSLYPDDPTPPGDVLHWQSDNLNWNYMCASCHSTGLKRGYDLDSDSYSTTWEEMTVACEACHGPASNHVESPTASYGMTGASEDKTDIGGREDLSIQNAELNMCAACHSRRTPLVEPAVHDAEFLDQYAPALIGDGLYFADGQIQDEVYVYGSFLQSRMAQQGVTCSDCHDPHTGERRLPGDALCQSCHAGSIEDVAIHAVHESESGIDASCEDCHMPSRVYMGVDARQDHRFGIPDPLASHETNSPDVCQNCHVNEDAEWAAEAIGRTPGPNAARAASTLATSSEEGMQRLFAVLIDSTTSRIMKGSLIARLATRPDADAIRIAMVGLSSGNPFERVGSLRAFAGWAGVAPLPNLENVFADEIRWVRTEAVSTALSFGFDEFDEEPARSAMRDYQAAQMATAERPESHINLAHMHEVLGEWFEAQGEFEIASRVAPENPDVLVAWGLFSGRWANAVSTANPARYRELRTHGEDALRGAVLMLGEDGSDALYMLGLFLGEERPRLPAAAAVLKESFRLDPENPRKAYNAALAHQQMEEYRDAEGLLLQALQLSPDDYQFRDALTILFMQTERWQEANESNDLLRQMQPERTDLAERGAYISAQIQE